MATNIRIAVNGDLERALKRLKRTFQSELTGDVRRKESYERPGEKRRRLERRIVKRRVKAQRLAAA